MLRTSPPRGRPQKRIDYRHFPAPYFDAIEHFLRNGFWQSPAMRESEAYALRTDLYRLFGFLRNATPGDDYAFRLASIAGCIVIRKLPSPSLLRGDSEEQWHLRFDLNPLVDLTDLQKEFSQ